MTRDDVIEAARSAIAFRGCQDEECDHPYAEPGGCLCLMHAIAALSALEAMGLAIVPVEATEEMIEAGHSGTLFPQKTWNLLLSASPLRKGDPS